MMVRSSCHSHRWNGDKSAEETIRRLSYHRIAESRRRRIDVEKNCHCDGGARNENRGGGGRAHKNIIIDLEKRTTEEKEKGGKLDTEIVFSPSVVVVEDEKEEKRASSKKKKKKQQVVNWGKRGKGLSFLLLIFRFDIN